MTLTVELYAAGHWKQMGRLRPGEQSGSLSDSSRGQREILRFRAETDCSIVERSRGGLDYETGRERAVVPLAGWQELARLTEPGETYERSVQTDRMTDGVPVRWRHEP